ncbi:ATP-grasp domain-containing protein [Streptomyces sp. NBRC 109706]|uniref:ATP-grasp domain-containing protein n=1 Tax=Streptomyces sp. NBRC 109706 TaxID=1550035 RepID=UPI0007860349|nr:ATP-grasp domain-containing protein [Streptomyces sp. NBRC 109706]
MNELLLVGIGVMGRPYADAAARLGCRLRIVDTIPGTEVPGAAYHRIDEAILDESWYGGMAAALAAAPSPDAIVAFAESQVLAGALAQDQLGLPGPSLHAALLSRNKALQRAACARQGVRQPEHLLTRELGEARQWMRDRLPVVVKPVSASASIGVELVTDKAELDDVVDRRSGEGKLLVERLVAGPEYSWEALVGEGEVLFETVTAKETTPPPYFVELCHRIGHRFESQTARQVEELTRGVLRALGMRTGLVHLEFRIGPDGPVLIEVAVRTPGDHIIEAVGRAYDFDPYEAVVRLAAGLPVTGLRGRELRSHTAVMFVTGPPGRIRQISGADRVRDHPAVSRLTLDLGPGDTIAPLTSSLQRAGHLLIEADSPEQRDEALDFARHHLHIETEQPTT